MVHHASADAPAIDTEWKEFHTRNFQANKAPLRTPVVLKDLGLKAGQSMTLDSTPDGRITLAPRRRHRLVDLLAQCDPKAPPPADLALWDSARPAGQEAW